MSTDFIVSDIERLDAASSKVQTAGGPGAKMIWRRWGAGPALVLLHGGAGSWMHWIRNIEALARTRTVWAPDLPGFGDSDAPDGRLDADTLAPYVLDGIKQILGQQRFDLVGFSFGGLVSALIAAERPAGLERLVLISVAGLGLVTQPPQLKSMRGAQNADEREEVFRSNLNALMLFDKARVDDLAIAVQERSAPRDRAKGRTLVLTDIMLGLSAQWPCPVYGVWARQDALYRDQLDSLMRVTDTLGLRETVILDDAGHWVQYECAEEVNDLLVRFLNEPVAQEQGRVTNAE